MPSEPAAAAGAAAPADPTEATETSRAARYASPVDYEAFGEYRIGRRPDVDHPLYRFAGRVTADGSSGFRAEPGRYHLYAGWFCPWAQRTTITRALLGLEDVVSVSSVDGERDGRGWGFRETHGVDPVNGFTLLREAYEATEPGFDGHVSVPTLWDRETGQIVSNDFRLIGIDLATQFGAWATGPATYDAGRAAAIESLDSWLGVAVNRGVSLAALGDRPARRALAAALTRLDLLLAGRRFLLGDELSEADVRLWVTLVRYDVAANATGAAGRPVTDFAALWGWARDLYARPAFRDTTDFASFATVPAPDWAQPHGREHLTAAAA